MTSIKTIDVISGGAPWTIDSMLNRYAEGAPLNLEDISKSTYRKGAAENIKATVNSIRRCNAKARCWHPACPACGGKNGRLHRAVYPVLMHEARLTSPDYVSALEVSITYRDVLTHLVPSSGVTGDILRGSVVVLANALAYLYSTRIVVAVSPACEGAHDIVARCLMLQDSCDIEDSDAEIESMVRKSMKSVVLPKEVDAEISARQLAQGSDGALLRLLDISAPKAPFSIWSEIFKGDTAVIEAHLTHNYYAEGTKVVHCYGQSKSTHDVLVPIGVELPKTSVA